MLIHLLNSQLVLVIFSLLFHSTFFHDYLLQLSCKIVLKELSWQFIQEQLCGT
jgi:hypothetical protein